MKTCASPNRRASPRGNTPAGGAVPHCGRLLMAVLILFAAACSLPGKPQTQARQTYLLQGNASAAAATGAASKPCLSLRVSTPVSAPGFGTARMAYSTQPQRLDYFAFHEWVDTPARMLAAMMENRLDASGLVGAVLTGSADVATDLRLDSELKRLQQDFNGADSMLTLEIKLSLVDVTGRRLLDAKTFSYTENASADPQAGVAAANRAAERFLADMTEFLMQSISHLSCPREQG